MATFTSRLEFRLTPSAWTDVTDDLHGADPLTLEYGIFGDSPTDRVAEPGTLAFSLDNSQYNSASLQGYYSPWHTNKRTGFDLDLIVRYSLSRDGGSTWYVQFLGTLVDILPIPGAYRERRVRCVAKCPLEGYAERLVPPTLTVQTDALASELYADLVLQMADPLETGGYYGVVTDELDPVYLPFYRFPIAWDSILDERTTARQELHRIAMSEFGYVLFVPSWNDQGEGPSLVFVSHEYTEVHTTIAATFSDTMQDVRVEGLRGKIADRIQITTHPVDIDVAQVLWSMPTSSEPPLLQPGASITIRAPFRDPANGRERIGGVNPDTPVPTTHYLMNSVADGSGTNLTANFTVTPTFSGNSAELVIANGGTTAGYITFLELTGDGVYRRDWVTDITEAGSYGSRIVRWEMPYQSDPGVAEDLGRAYLDMHASTDSQHAKQIRFCGNTSDTFADYLLETELLDRIALTETVTGLDHEAFVKGIRVEVQAGGLAWATWNLEAVPMAVWNDNPFSAGNFTGSGAMTVTLTSPDQVTYAYQINGKAMKVVFWLENVTIAGTPSTAIQITIPASRVASKQMGQTIFISDNGTRGLGLATVAAAGTIIACQLASGGNWAASTNATQVIGQIEIPLQ